MVEILSENTNIVDGNFSILTQELSDGSKVIQQKHGDTVSSTTIIQKNGSYVIWDKKEIKIEELTPDGYLRKYNPQTRKLIEETSPQKIVTSFYDNGNIKSIYNPQAGTKLFYYENRNLMMREEKDYSLYLDINGNVNYELKDGKLTINSDWFSYYRLGVKTDRNDTHWDEKCTLDPHKKTLLSLGGDQTKDARAANGNNNSFVNVLGLSPEEKVNLQLVSCYRPHNNILRFLWYKVKGFDKQLENDYEREILQKFMPFMADIDLKRYTDQELAQNFRNIMIQTHCYGANDLPRYSKAFKKAMSTLGYSEKAQKHALKQIICITNNSQRELNDDLGFTCIHRYSVTDGQFEPEYKREYSAEYPIFMDDHAVFATKKVKTSAFIETGPSEMIMAFDRILADNSKSNEHNEAFWVTNEEKLTLVGKSQARLIASLGHLWYHNRRELPNVLDLVKQAAQTCALQKFFDKSVSVGKKLKMDKKNMLINHHILQSEWNKFKSSDAQIPKTGIYRLLSDKYRE